MRAERDAPIAELPIAELPIAELPIAELPIAELETMPDCVHLLVVCDPQYGIRRFVKQIESQSLRLLRDKFPSLRSRLSTLWTNSYFYFAATISEVIKHYVENQRNT